MTQSQPHAEGEMYCDVTHVEIEIFLVVVVRKLIRSNGCNGQGEVSA